MAARGRSESCLRILSTSSPRFIFSIMARESLSRISPAAFLVKVTHKISLTSHLPPAIRRIRRSIITVVLPLPAEAETTRLPPSLWMTLS